MKLKNTKYDICSMKSKGIDGDTNISYLNGTFFNVDLLIKDLKKSKRRKK